MQQSALCRSRRELSNAYLLANFRFDTAENEPSKVCRICAATALAGAPGAAALRCGLGPAGDDRDLPPARGLERGGRRQHAGPLRLHAARARGVQLLGGLHIGPVLPQNMEVLIRFVSNVFASSLSNLRTAPNSHL